MRTFLAVACLAASLSAQWLPSWPEFQAQPLVAGNVPSLSLTAQNGFILATLDGNPGCGVPPITAFLTAHVYVMVADQPPVASILGPLYSLSPVYLWTYAPSPLAEPELAFAILSPVAGIYLPLQAIVFQEATDGTWGVYATAPVSVQL